MLDPDSHLPRVWIAPEVARALAETSASRNESESKGDKSMSNRHIVVVFLADAARSDELAQRIGSDLVEVCVAHSSDEFYRLVYYQRVDAVVIENALRCFLSG